MGSGIKGLEMMDGTVVRDGIFTLDDKGVYQNTPDAPKVGDVDKREKLYLYHAIKAILFK